MGELTVVSHPLVQSKLTLLRNKETGTKEFRELVEEITMLIFYEAAKDIPTCDVEIETPIKTTRGKTVARKYCFLPIMRAGLGMVEGLVKLMPTAKVGHIGLYRDPETLLPVEYYCKLPDDISERVIFVLDPMLATGGTSCAAIRFLKDRGVQDISVICLIASPQGLKKIQTDFPDVNIFSAAFDDGLTENGYIYPGLGDAGDRLFGTK